MTRKVLFLVPALTGMVGAFANFSHNVGVGSKVELQSLISENETESSECRVGSEERAKLTSTPVEEANMVHYDVASRTVSLETFDVNSYDQRPSSASSIVAAETLISREEMLDNGLLDELVSESFAAAGEQDVVAPASILDPDERTLVHSPKSWPYRGTVLIVAAYNNLPATDGTVRNIVGFGSGFLEGPNLLVTAGHVVYGDVTNSGVLNDNRKNPRFPDKISVYAGFDGEEDERTSSYVYYAEVDAINLQKEYYFYTGSDYDWAACELNWNLGSTTGYYGKIGNWFETGAEVFSYGYPGDKNQTMWETHGHTISQSNYTFSYDLDTVSGQSGSPVFMTSANGSRYVCGIHTYGSTGSNGGTKINNFIYHYLNSYVTSRH